MLTGTIVKGIGGFYYVSTARGVYACRARGIFRKDNITPTVGDHVEISVLDEKDMEGSLDKILPRRNELIRPRVANVDQAVVVFAAKSPNPNLDLLDRFLLLAEEQALDVVLCINKTDLDKKKAYQLLVDLYREAGFAVCPVSAAQGTGVDALRDALTGKISVFAGPSGVGKSSLINAVAPELALQTGEISQKIQRGKHTTRHAELIEIFPGSYIVDSPGFTSLSLEHIDPEDLRLYFREFAKVTAPCRYHGCSHTHEPACAVKAAVGSLISPIRYERYVNLYTELNERKRQP